MNEVVATNYTRLARCLKQYQSVRLLWRSAVRFGAAGGTIAGIGQAERLAAQKDARSVAEDTARGAGAALRIRATTKLVMEDGAVGRPPVADSGSCEEPGIATAWSLCPFSPTGV